MSENTKSGERLTHPFTVFLGAFVLLLITNFQALDDPPYWDALLGIFNQSLWLADHNFDYVELMRQDPFWKGGPLITPLYLFAPIYALMFKLFAPATMWVLAHLMNLTFAALALAVFYALLKDRLGPRLSLLWCAALALDPIWSGQCAAIYLEIPQAAAYLLALRAFDKQRFKSAALWCALAFLVKISGLLLALAFAVYGPARLVLGRLFRAGEARAEASPRAAWWLAAPLLPMLGLYFSHRFAAFINPGPGYVFETFSSDAPQQLAALALFVIMACVALARAGPRRRFLERPRDLDMVLLLGALVLGFWLGVFLHPRPLVRYTVALWGPTLLALALLVDRLLPRRLGSVLPLALALFGAVNQGGVLLPELPPHLRRSGDRLERSREYLTDLEANRRLCRELEDELQDAPFLTKFPFTRSLGRAEFGYVRAPLPRLYALPPLPVGGGARLLTREVFNAPDLHVIYAPNSFEFNIDPSFAPTARAVIAKRSQAVGGFVVVHRRAAPRRR